MENLVHILGELVTVLWELLVWLWSLVKPLLPLLVWICYWLFAVDWVRLRRVLLAGGWVGLVLIGLLMTLVWGEIAPPEGGAHSLFGLTVSNFVGKAVYVSMLFCIMLLCGAVQLSGALGECCRFDEDAVENADHGDTPATLH